MTASNYENCLKQMLVYEGGYSNHPSDPGGVTLEGVIQKRYDEYRRDKGLPRRALKASMRNTIGWISERNEIYRRYYWNPVRGDALHDGVDLAVFDYAVNSGPGRALPHFKPFRDLPPVQAVKKLCARRLAFVRGLGTFRVFGPGWSRRIASVEAIGVKMALKAQAVPPKEIKKELEQEAKKAGDAAKKQGTGAGTAAGGGAVVTKDPTTVGVDPAAVSDSFNWLQIGLGVAVAAVVIYLGYRTYINWQRKKAYADAAAS